MTQRNAGIEPNDSGEPKFSKQLLVFATGLVCTVSMLWLVICWAIGAQFSTTLPYLHALALAANLPPYGGT